MYQPASVGSSDGAFIRSWKAAQSSKSTSPSPSKSPGIGGGGGSVGSTVMKPTRMAVSVPSGPPTVSVTVWLPAEGEGCVGVCAGLSMTPSLSQSQDQAETSPEDASANATASRSTPPVTSDDRRAVNGFRFSTVSVKKLSLPSSATAVTRYCHACPTPPAFHGCPVSKVVSVVEPSSANFGWSSARACTLYPLAFGSGEASPAIRVRASIRCERAG